MAHISTNGGGAQGPRRSRPRVSPGVRRTRLMSGTRSSHQVHFLALLLVCVIPLSSCDLGCENEEVKRVPSPDGRFEAVVFQRDCGASTDFSTQISIVRARSSIPHDGGNIFVADCDHGRAPAADWGGPPAAVQWADSRTLVVEYHPDSRVFFKSETIAVRTGWFHSESVSVRFAASAGEPP